MNQKDKKWIRQWLNKIWVEDNENDAQADDITEFLSELAKISNYQYEGV